MKRIIIGMLTFLLVIVMSADIFSQNTPKKKVAVYTTGDVENSVKKIVGAKLVTAIASSGKFAAVERTADFLAALSKENDYQTSGEVRDSQIAKLGQKFGVKLVVVADISEAFDELFIASRLINVETGLVEKAFDTSGPAESMSQLISLTQDITSGLFSGMDSQAASSDISGNANGHQYVDLGLPSGTKWATCNLGATTPERTGKFYSWGVTTPYTDRMIYSSEDVDKLPGYNISGNARYDAATANWGAPWRIPKVYEWKELLDNCRLVTTEINGLKVVKAIGPNNNSIIIPLGGHQWGEKLERVGDGDYWSSDSAIDKGEGKCVSIFGSEGYQITETSKIFGGLSVRPVLD